MYLLSSPRLTAIEEELLELSRTLGSQQSAVEQLELELEEEQGGVKKGQRWDEVVVTDVNFAKETPK